VGLAGAIIAVSEDETGGKPDFASAWSAMVDVHETAGRRLAELWRLPSEIGTVIGCHHGTRPYPSPTAAAVALADLLVSEQGAGLDGECDPRTAESACARLGLASDALTGLRQDAARVVALIT
jgi:hypothetical protein